MKMPAGQVRGRNGMLYQFTLAQYLAGCSGCVPEGKGTNDKNSCTMLPGGSEAAAQYIGDGSRPPVAKVPRRNLRAQQL